VPDQNSRRTLPLTLTHDAKASGRRCQFRRFYHPEFSLGSVDVGIAAATIGSACHGKYFCRLAVQNVTALSSISSSKLGTSCTKKVRLTRTLPSVTDIRRRSNSASHPNKHIGATLFLRSRRSGSVRAARSFMCAATSNERGKAFPQRTHSHTDLPRDSCCFVGYSPPPAPPTSGDVRRTLTTCRFNRRSAATFLGRETSTQCARSPDQKVDHIAKCFVNFNQPSLR
jgi:hypothetical protein